MRLSLDDAINFFHSVPRSDIVAVDITPDGKNIKDYVVLRDLVAGQMRCQKADNPEIPSVLNGHAHEIFITGKPLICVNFDGKGRLNNSLYLNYEWIRISSEMQAEGVRLHCYRTDPFQQPDFTESQDTHEFFWEEGLEIETGLRGKVKGPGDLILLSFPGGKRISLFASDNDPKIYAIRFLKCPYID